MTTRTLPVAAAILLTQLLVTSELASGATPDRLLLGDSDVATKEPPSAVDAEESLASAIAAIGTWTAQPPPHGRFGHTVVYDPSRDRIIVFGGYREDRGDLYLNDTWVLSATEPATWTALSPGGEIPPGRFMPTAIYDSVRDQMLVFGGFDGSSFLDDLWALSLGESPTWTRLYAGGVAPSGRNAHVSIYDPVADRMVVFGGDDGSSLLNDTWALSLETQVWEEFIPSGDESPVARDGHIGIYDALRHRILVFGGRADSTYLNDIWSLSLDDVPSWTSITASEPRPSERYCHVGVYDSDRDDLVVFGGVGANYLTDTWSLSLSDSNWKEMATGVTTPDVRVVCSAVYNTSHHVMLVIGGVQPGFPGLYLNDVWQLSLVAETWTNISPSLSPFSGIGRKYHTAIYDSKRDQMVIFAGEGYGGRRRDVWAYSLEDEFWTDITPVESHRTGLLGHSAIYAPGRDQMIVFGGGWGCVFQDCYFNETFVLTLDEPFRLDSLSTSGEPPMPRRGHTACYDTARNRMLVFGGRDSVSVFRDIWALSLDEVPTWTRLLPAGTPPNLTGKHTAILDPVRDRLVVLAEVQYRTQLWQLSLGASPEWSQLTAAGSFPGYYPTGSLTSIYDLERDQMVVFGLSPNAWALSLREPLEWTQLFPPDDQSVPWRSGHTAIHDPIRDRMIIYGGQNLFSHLNDVWALSWDDTTPVRLGFFTVSWIDNSASLRWAVADASNHAGFHIYRQTPGKDRQKMTDQLLMGRSEYEFIDDSAPKGGAEYWLAAISRTGETTWHGPVVLPPVSLPARLVLSPPAPNPFVSETQITYSLPEPQHVSLAIYDLQGRRVATLVEKDQGAGEYTVSWDGQIDTGLAASGLYFLRFRADKATKTQKLMLVR